MQWVHLLNELGAAVESKAKVPALVNGKQSMACEQCQEERARANSANYLG